MFFGLFRLLWRIFKKKTQTGYHNSTYQVYDNIKYVVIAYMCVVRKMNFNDKLRHDGLDKLDWNIT